MSNTTMSLEGLDAMFINNKLSVWEGYSTQNAACTEVMRKYASRPEVKTILEIGFNAGHSALTFLTCNPEATVVSFDLGWHDYTPYGKAYIDVNFPGRHKLILGDSRTTVIEYVRNNIGKQFDLIFVDGGHEYDTALADTLNVRHLAHKDTYILIDDVLADLNGPDWTHGPTRVWLQSVESKFINKLEHCIGNHERGVVVGRFNFDKH